MPHPSKLLHRWRPALFFVLTVSCSGDDGTAPRRNVASVAVLGAPVAPVLVGTGLQLTAVPRDGAGNPLSDRAVVWTSSDSATVRVSAGGAVATVAPGRATVRAASEGKSDSVLIDARVGGALDGNGGTITVYGGAVSITVPKGALSRPSILTVAPAMHAATPSLVAGTVFELGPPELTFAQPAILALRYDRARLLPSQGESSLLLGVYTPSGWQPVAGSGVQTTTTTATGFVTRGGIYGVLAAPVHRVTVTGLPANGEIFQGYSLQLVATGYDDQDNPLSGRPVNWTTSDPNTVSVSSSGRITGVAVGSATITATIEERSAAVSVTVKLVPVASVSVSPTSRAIYVDQALALKATLKDGNGNTLTGREVAWSTSDATRATVDANGVVTGVAPGTVTVTATSEGQSGVAQVAVLAAITADWSSAAEWTTFQANASHTGFVDAAVDPRAFRALWTTTVVPSVVLTPVTAGDGKVFVATVAHFGSQQLHALDAQSGVKKWVYDFGSIHSVNAPAFGNGKVYVQTGGHENSFLWAFDAANGAIAFRNAYGNQWSRYMAPVVVGGAVYLAGGYYGGMYGYSATDGARKWFRELNQYDNFTPAVRDGVVYAYTGSYSPKLTAADAETGAVVYEIADPNFVWNGWSMESSLALGSEQTAFATQAGRLVAFDLAGRAVKWEKPGSFAGNVTVANGVIYVYNNRQLEARRESDGAPLWVWVPPEGSPVGTIVATRNLLFVSTAANTYAIDIASHQSVWSYPGGGQLALSSQGLLFIAQTSGKLAAIAVR